MQETGSGPNTPSALHVGRSPIEGFITFRVSRLKKLLDRYSGSSLGDGFGLSLAEWRVLTMLHATSPASVKSLSVQLMADKAEISRACAALVEQGRASRAGAGRSALFAITPLGRRVHDEVMPSRQTIQTELAAVLNASEIKALTKACEKLTLYLTAKLAERNGASHS